ncbi:MAG TPA: hypothetical protein VJ894_00360 [Cryomorphaceae bacterium]|nr:hypothetical protein [Cryomorphaceae bacterium]
MIVKEEKLIIQMFSGKLTYEKWLKSAEAIWENPEYDSSYCGIVDFRKADVQMKIKEVKAIIELLSSKNNQALRADTAILIDEPTAAAFASIFADSMKELINTKIVTTEEGAAAKLSLNRSVFESLYGTDAVTLVLD